MTRTPTQRRKRWVTIRNIDTEDMPGYGAGYIQGTETKDGKLVYLVKRNLIPDPKPEMIIINGPVVVRKNGYGQGTQDWPTQALLYGEYDSLPTAVSPATGEWHMAEGSSFTLVAADASKVDDKRRTVLVTANPYAGRILLAASVSAASVNDGDDVEIFEKPAGSNAYYTLHNNGFTILNTKQAQIIHSGVYRIGFVAHYQEPATGWIKPGVVGLSIYVSGELVGRTNAVVPGLTEDYSYGGVARAFYSLGNSPYTAVDGSLLPACFNGIATLQPGTLTLRNDCGQLINLLWTQISLEKLL